MGDPQSSPLALKGSVDFGPEVTSSDKSLKVLLNAEDKVRVWVPWISPGALLPQGSGHPPWEGRLSPQDRGIPTS